ncbi:concanavalin A-like lectin/glucanase domain-containing protein [Gilbertella persicaria]|uniref:GH16 domain-containing protein n=1 Tax=Rhizopus stolonifer TaxID=4846 RepID=A0A367JKR9_RHIST|nr:concanavalin A-like lectin/glucanase domain-containing protein [Gilbertella persicaria]KAI8071103.1 concanavalin A-like lectin/glucanase domain-containing protein [Gilbertella persicaria]RCH90469.1 hypothetical protein CU098_008484 [Rhizopus stolonifer]
MHWFIIVLLIVKVTAIQLTTNLNQCDCGYQQDKDTQWQELWHIDFDQTKSNHSLIDPEQFYSFKDLFFSNYVIQAKFNDTYPRTFKRTNVQITEAGLEIAVKTHLIANASRYDITCGGVGTDRQDILYGSFRSFIRSSAVSGTVAGMFLYHAEGEIDIELVSALQPPQAYFAMHPLIYDENGRASPLTHGESILGFDPSLDYHEYRFDWFPNLTVFYVDGIEKYRMTTHVLGLPSRVMFNHWTDGNPNFSQGPAKQDASIFIKNMTFFFNATSSSSLPCQQTTTACPIQSKSHRCLSMN